MTRMLHKAMLAKGMSQEKMLAREMQTKAMLAKEMQGTVIPARITRHSLGAAITRQEEVTLLQISNWCNPKNRSKALCE